MTEPAFIAVDWGTSSFRLWMLDRAGKPLAERRSGEGMTTAASSGFAAILQSHLDAIAAPADLPVLICGMAGARQGWIEAGYIDLPASISGIAAGADHYIVASGEADLACRITHVPKACFDD